MTYNILAVRSGESEETDLYPFPGELADTVEMTEEDGESLPPLTATELTVSQFGPGEKPRQAVRVQKMKAKVHITRSRTAVACSKYEKGGGWTPFGIAAVPVALAANTVSKVRAARRRRGKMLVGHVGHQQVMRVGFRRTSGLMSKDVLRIVTFDPTAPGFRGLTLDITLAGGQTSGAALARQIAQWAASHRLEVEGDSLNDEQKGILEALLDPPPLEPKPKEFSSYFLGDPDLSPA